MGGDIADKIAVNTSWDPVPVTIPEISKIRVGGCISVNISVALENKSYAS